jgi:hypothetical protein
MQSIKLFRLLASVMFLLVSTLSTGPGAGVWVGVGTGDLAWGADKSKTNGKGKGKSGSSQTQRKSSSDGGAVTPEVPGTNPNFPPPNNGGYWGPPKDYKQERTNARAANADAADRAERAIERTSCDADKKALDESMEKCKGKCLADMKRCSDSASGGNYVIGELLSAWAGPDFGSTLENSQCEITPDQWLTDKKTLEKEIEEAEKNIAKLNEKIVENEDKYKALIKELNEKLPAERKTKKEKERDLEGQRRLSDEKLLAQQNSLNESIQKVVEEQKSLREEISNMYSSNRLKMMSLSDNAIITECTNKARGFKKTNYPGAGGSSFSGQGNAISHGSTKKNAILAFFEDCKTQLFQQRKDSLEAAQRAIAKNVDTLNSRNEKIVELQTTSALLVKNMNAAADELKVMKADLESEFMDFQARLQKEAYDALDSKTKVEENIKKEITIEQKRQREKKTRLNSMGSKRPQTFGGKKDTTISGNFADYNGAVKKLLDFTERCCKLDGYVRTIDAEGGTLPNPPKAPKPFINTVYCKDGYATTAVEEAASITGSTAD